MGFWNKLGKIALSAAPYIAAPFTGGASLAFAPAAKGAVSAWSQSDANKAAQKGVAPSKFDSYLGMANGISGMASGLTNGFGMGNKIPTGGWQGQVARIGGAMEGGIPGIGSGGVTAGTGPVYGSGPVNGNPYAMSAQQQGGMNKENYQRIRGNNNQNQYNETDFQSALQAGINEAMQRYQNQYQQQPQQQEEDSGYMSGGNKFDAYGQFDDAVGHEGIAKSGMNRDAYRDAWMGSGIGDSAAMDAWLAQHGGQRLNDAGVVRTPFGEILDMGIGYKGGRGRAGWTNIGMNG